MRRLSIELPESLHQQIKSQASLEGVSMRAYVLRRLDLPVDEAGEPSCSQPAEARHTSGSMRELIHNRHWRGTRTPAEIQAQVAEERASWSVDD